jgi:hypothetical protein
MLSWTVSGRGEVAGPDVWSPSRSPARGNSTLPRASEHQTRFACIGQEVVSGGGGQRRRRVDSHMCPASPTVSSDLQPCHMGVNRGGGAPQPGSCRHRKFLRQIRPQREPKLRPPEARCLPAPAYHSAVAEYLWHHQASSGHGQATRR